MPKHWRIFVDWDADGICETGEHSRVFYYSATRGRDRMLSNDSKGFEQQKVGKATLYLDNDDRRFDPFYTSSPLYGSIAPERKIKIGVETGGTDFILQENGDKILQENGDKIYISDGDYYPRFTGRISDIQPAMRSGRRSVMISALDGWKELRYQDGVWIDVVADTTTAAAIAAILDEIGWSSDDYSLSGNGDDLSYWWTEGDSAALEIWRLVHSNLGQVFVSNDGKLTFVGRHQTYNTSEDMTITESILDENIQTPYQWRQLKNKVRVEAHPLIERSSIELWRLNDTPLVLSGDSVDFWADMTYEDRPVVTTSITTPVSSTDYTMNSQSDGGGTNLTGNFSVTVSKLGRVTKVTVTNNGVSSGYITLLKLRGDGLDSPNVTAVEAEDDDTIYTISTLYLDLIWQQSTETARDFAGWLVSWLSSPLLFPIVALYDQDTYTLPYDLFTRVRADLDTLEIDTDFYISKIEERWLSENGQGFAVVWDLEPAEMSYYWQFTTSIGITSRFAY